MSNAYADPELVKVLIGLARSKFEGPHKWGDARKWAGLFNSGEETTQMKKTVDRVTVVLRYVSQKEFERSNYKDGPRLAGGVNGRGWYWALVDADGKTDDEWWFGPEATAEMARFAAEQEDGYAVSVAIANENHGRRS